MRCVTVVIADRRPMVLHGLMNLLDERSGFKVVASSEDGTSCIEAIRRWVPDIAIFDNSMRGLTGSEILAIANRQSLPTRLILFSASIDERELVLAAAAGAYGVIPKDVTPEILLECLRRVVDGQRLLPLSPSDWIVSREQGMAPIAENMLTVLTERERQIMRLVSEGLSNKQIGRKLNITDGTIKAHLHRIFQKLDINNRTLLATLAISKNDRMDQR